jgi:hypothetical protein
MTTLQIQHYEIYPFVGKEKFTNIIMLFTRPQFISETEVILFLALNVAALISTFIWQRKLQGQMAIIGYDESKVKLLLTTNWIRTTTFLLQGIIVVSITMQALKR